jgi:hypothetical protein
MKMYPSTILYQPNIRNTLKYNKLGNSKSSQKSGITIANGKEIRLIDHIHGIEHAYVREAFQKELIEAQV